VPADVEERSRRETEFDLRVVVGRISIFHASDFAGGGRTKTVQPSKKFLRNFAEEREGRDGGYQWKRPCGQRLRAHGQAAGADWWSE
jgi:hypothetical protein